MFRKGKKKSREEDVRIEAMNNNFIAQDKKTGPAGRVLDTTDGFDANRFVDLTPPEDKKPTLLGPRQPCQYIGTFPVTCSDDGDNSLQTHKERTRFVKERLKDYRKVQKGILVAMLVSAEGIKVVTPDEKRVRMAHALQRISFATCDPDYKIFVYMTNNPSPLGISVHTHVFLTRMMKQAQDLTAMVGKAFKMAFANSKIPGGNGPKLQPIMDEPVSPGGKSGQGRKWAKLEAQHGHDHSEHALRARKKKVKPEKAGNESSPALSQGADLHDSPPVPRRNRPHTPPEGHRSRSPGLSTDEQNLSRRDEQNDFRDHEVHRSPRQNRKMNTPASMVADSSAPQERRSESPNVISASASANLAVNSALPEEPRSSHIDQERSRSPSPVDDAPPLPPRGRALEQTGPPNDPAEAARVSEAFSDPDMLSNDAQEVPRHENLGKRNSHEDECWYMPGIPREFIMEMLEKSEEGAFFVRDSQSRPGCYALTMRVPNEINVNGFGNFLIVKSEDGVMLQGFERSFPNLTSLIAHYAAAEDGLPCKLLLAGSNLLCDDDDYVNGLSEDPDYQNLFDFTSMLEELK